MGREKWKFRLTQIHDSQTGQVFVGLIHSFCSLENQDEYMHIASIYASYSLNFLMYIIIRKMLHTAQQTLQLSAQYSYRSCLLFCITCRSQNAPAQKLNINKKIIGMEVRPFSVLKTIRQLLVFARISYYFAQDIFLADIRYFKVLTPQTPPHKYYRAFLLIWNPRGRCDPVSSQKITSP